MSCSVGSSTEKMSLKTVFQKTESLSKESSKDPPMNEWSSMFIDDAPTQSPKMLLYEQGLYHPGSGEICAKYICLSSSSVMSHLYYNYPCVVDPGIKEALLKPETKKKIYSPDGQELYLDLCDEMNIVPVRSFLRGLLNENIDLKYYGVNSVGVRAMCMAFLNNTCVRRLDLTSNFLSLDACYHLGQLLCDNLYLQEVVLSGCKLEPKGLKQLVDCLYKRTLRTNEITLLDLSKNDIGDDGFQLLADQIESGAVIKKLNLSYNNLTSVSGKIFATVIQGNNTITHLDLSWNKMFMDTGINPLLLALAQSEVLSELNLAWNMLTTTTPWQQVLRLRTLQVLNLSNNRLSTAAVKRISAQLHFAKELHTLDLSHNRLTPADALSLLNSMKNERVKLKNLYMEDTSVTKEFMETLKEVLSLRYRADTTVTHGIVLQNYSISTRNLKDIVMKRLKFLTRPQKKSNFDVAVVLLQAHKENKFIDARRLANRLKEAGMVSIDKDLFEEMCNCFPGPHTGMERLINLDGVIEYVHRLWPDSKLPPTPPAVVEPEPIKKKGKKKTVFKKKK